jgi:hypothetical protein
MAELAVVLHAAAGDSVFDRSFELGRLLKELDDAGLAKLRPLIQASG